MAGRGWARQNQAAHLKTFAVLASTKSSRSSTKYRGSIGALSHFSMASLEAACTCQDRSPLHDQPTGSGEFKASTAHNQPDSHITARHGMTFWPNTLRQCALGARHHAISACSSMSGTPDQATIEWSSGQAAWAEVEGGTAPVAIMQSSSSSFRAAFAAPCCASRPESSLFSSPCLASGAALVPDPDSEMRSVRTCSNTSVTACPAALAWPVTALLQMFYEFGRGVQTVHSQAAWTYSDMAASQGMQQEWSMRTSKRWADLPDSGCSSVDHAVGVFGIRQQPEAQAQHSSHALL